MKLSNLPAAAGELIAGCQVWEQFGMVLSPRQAVMLAQHQAAALLNTGRIDFGGGGLKKLADAFCGSPYIQPADWAGTLAESILLTLGAGRNPAVLLSTDLHTDFRQGQRRLSQKLTLSQHLLQTALASRPHIENRSLSDTLNSLKSFSKRWDFHFFAQEIPCDIDTSCPSRYRKRCVAWTM